MKTNPCQKALDKGRAERKTMSRNNPMCFSAYKIKEVRSLWSDYPEELEKIGRCATGDKQTCYGLRHSGREDKSRWVRKLPENMLHSLEYNVIGVLYALIGDGVPQSVVDDLGRYTRLELPRLVALGELARLEAKHDWKVLSKSLANKQGVVFDFVLGLQKIVDTVVNRVTQHER